MQMIWHQDVMAYPPAVMLGRTLPDATEKFVDFATRKKFPSLRRARRDEDNRVALRVASALISKNGNAAPRS